MSLTETLKRNHHHKNRCKRKIRFEKYIRGKVRAYQSKHNGIDPRKFIPKHSYYCNNCPFYYEIEIPVEERENHVGIVAVGQTAIGGCNFLNETDYDLEDCMLWDGVKECGIGNP